MMRDPRRKTVLEQQKAVTTGIVAETHLTCIFSIVIHDGNWVVVEKGMVW